MVYKLPTSNSLFNIGSKALKIIRISLYSKNGEQRNVEFNISGLSIITGASKKGKTSLLKIVEYCLGSSDCDVYYGHIRDTVSWYAITLQLPTEQLFLARKAPENGSKTSTEFLIISGEEIKLPTFSQIQSNTNLGSVLEYLTRLIGIPEQQTEVPEKNTRTSIQLNFKHSIYLYFQNQDEIANQKFIFHRQGEPFIPQMLKDTLPYFIGAFDDNRFADLDKLRKLRQEMARHTKKLKELESIKGNGLQKGYQLLAEATAEGLHQGDTFSINDLELINTLKKILEWQPDTDNHDTELSEKIKILEEQYNELIQEKKRINPQVRELKEYSKAMQGYESAVREQELRLKSIGLFKKLENYQSTNSYLPIFKNSLEKLNNELGTTHRSKPKINEALLKIENKQAELAEAIKKNQSALRILQEKDQEFIKKEKLNIAKAKVIGKISLYLDGINWSYDSKPIQTKIDNLKVQIENQEKKLDNEAVKEKLNAQLSCIGEDMTRWAKELGLEHSDHQIKLDINKLTVVADTPQGRIPLDKMGSGENWVGYHLVAHLALAKWFKEQNRPVANFLFFDQPTQVYFPSEEAEYGDLSEISDDEDRKAVHNMFAWLDRVCKEELGDSYQIIITDHADINEDWFQEAICDKKWRGEYALIPSGWYADNE